MQEATFAAGCFWGPQKRFKSLLGVLSTEVGYAGGHSDQPTYEDVCGGLTGHAEVVHLRFDPHEISYEDLLEAFFAMHDPTTINRQGPDVGSQYRSAVFTHTSEQQKAAEAMKAKLMASGRYPGPIVTEISPAGPFYRAEDYHQDYYG